MPEATISIEGETQEKLPTFYKGDYGFDITFTIKKLDGSAYDLSGKTVKLYIQNISSSTPDVTATLTVSSPTSGVAVYSVADGDFDSTGVFDFELEISETGVMTQTINLGRASIIEDLGN